MTRCEEFYEKVRREGNFCGMSKRALENVDAYIAFVNENPSIEGISEGPARVLMREKNPAVKAKAIKKLGKALEHGRRPTAAQVGHLVDDTREEKNHGGRPPTAKVEDLPGRKFSDFIEPKKPLVEEKNPEETDLVENDFVEADSDEGYPYEGAEDGCSGNIPVLPEEEDKGSDILLTPDAKEIGWNDPEITEKVAKESLKNAGHQDVLKELKSMLLPTEEAKQAIFDKCMFQACVWDMRGDEISRRARKALENVDQKEVEKRQKRLRGEN